VLDPIFPSWAHEFTSSF